MASSEITVLVLQYYTFAIIQERFLLLSLIPAVLLVSISRSKIVRTLLRLYSFHNSISFVTSLSVHKHVAALLV